MLNNINNDANPISTHQQLSSALPTCQYPQLSQLASLEISTSLSPLKSLLEANLKVTEKYVESISLDMQKQQALIAQADNRINYLVSSYAKIECISESSAFESLKTASPSLEIQPPPQSSGNTFDNIVDGAVFQESKIMEVFSSGIQYALQNKSIAEEAYKQQLVKHTAL